jgi:hypothetical protein
MTSHGDLLLDLESHGKVYLNGMLLPEAMSAKPFKLGYNFAQGKFSRDRHWVSDGSAWSYDYGELIL